MALTAEMQTPVKIHLVTIARQEDDEEKYELTLFGRYYRKGNSVYLKYDEVQEEGTVHTIVKISEDEALILRSGLIKMRLSFRLSEQRNGSHESPFGSLMLSTSTKTLTHHESNDIVNGRISLKYDLAMQGAHTGEYEMRIDYREDEV